MAFTEDLSVFFDPDDFGVAAYYDGGATPIYGIFEAAHVSPLAEFESVAPFFWCAVSSLPSLAFDKELVIDGDSYLVKGIRPDGTGIVELKLELNDDVPANARITTTGAYRMTSSGAYRVTA